MKKIVFITGMLFLFSTMCYSQEYAVDKGSWMISGRLNYSVEGSDLFKSNSDRTTSVKFMPAVEYFVAPHFFIGERLSYSYSTFTRYYYSRGETEIHTSSYSTFAIGPIVGYAFGKADSKVYPYLTSGIFYVSSGFNSNNSSSSDSGKEFIIGGGIIFPAKEHLGILMEAEYHITNLNNGSRDQSSVSLNIGIAGLLY
jgi:outer membrane protein W